MIPMPHGHMANGSLQKDALGAAKGKSKCQGKRISGQYPAMLSQGPAAKPFNLWQKSGGVHLRNSWH